MKVAPLPVNVPRNAIFGRLKCTECNYWCWTYWIDITIGGFTDFECPQCGSMTQQMEGPAYYSPNTNDRAEFFCHEAVTAIQRNEVARIKGRES